MTPAVLYSLRTDALHMAASFYVEPPADMTEFYKLYRFCELALLDGSAGLADEFGPREATVLQAVPRVGVVK